MEKELLAINALKRFFDWKKGVVQDIIAKHGKLKDKFVDREFGHGCYCFKRDIYGDPSFPHFQICKVHSLEFSIGEKLFESFTYKELESLLWSDDQRTALAHRVFLRKNIYLPKSFDLRTLSRIADEEFPGISDDKIKFVCNVYAQHYNYGEGSASASCYLTLTS